MSRHPSLRNRGRPSAVARRPRPVSQTDPDAALRALVHEGIVTAAALAACSDLGSAAMSMERLGELTSGMWRALSRELVAAAERLDRQVEEHLDNVSRRAKALDVAPAAVLAAGVAAGHLAEHRETLETMLPRLEEEVRRLVASEVLLGFSVDEEVLVENDLETADKDGLDAEPESGGDVPALAIDVWLFLWPVPFSPARVRILPELVELEPDITSVSLGATADDALVEALTAMPSLQREDILPALSALGLACWSAHKADEHGEDDDDDDDVSDDEADALVEG